MNAYTISPQVAKPVVGQVYKITYLNGGATTWKTIFIRKTAEIIQSELTGRCQVKIGDQLYQLGADLETCRKGLDFYDEAQWLEGFSLSINDGGITPYWHFDHGVDMGFHAEARGAAVIPQDSLAAAYYMAAKQWGRVTAHACDGPVTPGAGEYLQRQAEQILS